MHSDIGGGGGFTEEDEALAVACAAHVAAAVARCARDATAAAALATACGALAAAAARCAAEAGAHAGTRAAAGRFHERLLGVLHGPADAWAPGAGARRGGAEALFAAARAAARAAVPCLDAADLFLAEPGDGELWTLDEPRGGGGGGEAGGRRFPWGRTPAGACAASGAEAVVADTRRAGGGFAAEPGALQARGALACLPVPRVGGGGSGEGGTHGGGGGVRGVLQVSCADAHAFDEGEMELLRGARMW